MWLKVDCIDLFHICDEGCGVFRCVVRFVSFVIRQVISYECINLNKRIQGALGSVVST